VVERADGSRVESPPALGDDLDPGSDALPRSRVAD
jgi:hypothetical protein